MKALLVLALAAGLGSVSGERKRCRPLKIMAFNVQIFGQSKASKPDVMGNLTQIMLPMDLILVQEIRESPSSIRRGRLPAMEDLVRRMNAKCLNCFKYFVGKRSGDSNIKEQYGYIYRVSRVSIEDWYDYNDDKHNYFEREPTVVLVKDLCSKARVKEFVTIGIHTKPDDAVKELTELVKDFLMMGDFNMDCSYVNDKEEAALAIAKPPYQLEIGDDEDTTTSATHCAYDRAVVLGTAIERAVQNVKIVHYDRKADGSPSMTNAEAKRISDHYPIELELRMYA